MNPLEMLSSNFSVSESRKSSDYAIPYLEEKGTVRETSFLKPDRMEMGPAGSINSVESFEPAVGKIMFNRIPNKK